MKRLTFEGNFCDIAMCSEVPGVSFCENGSCSQKKVWERLKMYEDGRVGVSVDDGNIPDVIADLIEKSGMTRRKITEKSGVGANTIYGWISGKYAPTLSQLSWVLNVLGYHLEVVKNEDSV